MKKLLIAFPLVILGLLALVLAWAFLSYPSDYVLRLLRWGNADVYDYQKFPERVISGSVEPYTFTQAIDEQDVQARFESVPLVDGDLDQFLVDTGTQAFLVIQGDQLRYEKYYNGAERDSIVTSFSMAKSYTSALVGIAIAEGFIDSVDDPITKYLPELAERDSAFQQVTIQDLLMMSSGIRYEEFPFVNGDDAKTYYFPDLRDLALEQTEIVAKPGETFLYNNYHPLLLGLILERTTGVPVAEYLQEKIWHPAGMAFDASWSLDEEGFEKMESGINARAIDFAKFGRLYLHDGAWEGGEVVPEEWVLESTRPTGGLPEDYYNDSMTLPVAELFYKNLWWGVQRDGERDDFFAIGNFGQFIYVSPTRELVIVRNGEKYGVSFRDWVGLFYQVADSYPADSGQ